MISNLFLKLLTVLLAEPICTGSKLLRFISMKYNCELMIKIFFDYSVAPFRNAMMFPKMRTLATFSVYCSTF